MSSLGKNINIKDMSYFVQISKNKSIKQKAKELKKINKFKHASSLDSKLKSLINYIIKIIGAIILIVFIFTVIYYSSIEFLNMKYGGDYKDMYDKPQTGAEKFRSIPNVGEQVKIKAEREMIFNKICDEIKRLE